MPSRRRFLAATGLAALGAPLGLAAGQAVPAPVSPLPAAPDERPVIKPPRLRPGHTVGLVTPAGAIFDEGEIREAEAALARLGLRTKRGAHVLDRHGYLGGTDVGRAADIMTMFRDPEVKAILPLRGGWGCARLLPYLDYDVIRANPKIVCGYSDITALLTAIYARTGLVTFHGPVGTSTWNDFSTDSFRRVLFGAETPVLRPAEGTRVETMNPGVARGRLLGGNLSVLSGIVGTGFVPEGDGHILFLEEVSEEPYRIDRMITQLKLSGLLRRVTGLVFGDCRDCAPETGYVSLSLLSVLDDHLRSLGMPAFYGTAIGHVANKFTLPVGVLAEMDANTGTIRLLEPAVV